MTEKRPQKHAELAIQYWQQAAIDHECRKNWEVQSINTTWSRCTHKPLFDEGANYRYIPPQEYIKVGDIFVPAPVREPLETQKKYYTIGSAEVFSTYWDGGGEDIKRLNNGTIHLTEESAQLHLDAMIKVNNTIVEKE